MIEHTFWCQYLKGIASANPMPKAHANFIIMSFLTTGATCILCGCCNCDARRSAGIEVNVKTFEPFRERTSKKGNSESREVRCYCLCCMNGRQEHAGSC